MKLLNNFIAAALVGACAQAVAGPTLSLDVTPNPVVVGSSVQTNVLISDIADLYAYEFTLTFDASVLQATGISEGMFLGTAGATFGSTGVIDNTAGTISFIYNTLLGPVPGANGSGSLLNVTFQALGAGSAALSFADLLFLDSASADILVEVDGAVVTAVPEPGSFLLFGAALVAAGAMRRRQLAARS